MKLYILTLRGYDTLGDTIIKIFSDKSALEKWLVCADEMEKELFGSPRDPNHPISTQYLVREAELDNLDFIELCANAKNLGNKLRSSGS